MIGEVASLLCYAQQQMVYLKPLSHDVNRRYTSTNDTSTSPHLALICRASYTALRSSKQRTMGIVEIMMQSAKISLKMSYLPTNLA